MPNGNISGFLQRDHQFNRQLLVRLDNDSLVEISYMLLHARSQLIDIVRGLTYLHSQNVVHGDLKGVSKIHKLCFNLSLMKYAQPNILISNEKTAVLCDFGLTSLTTDVDSAHASSVNNADGSIRWMAPERLSIFDGNKMVSQTRVTKESDMYSLAMVVIEVCSLLQKFMPNLINLWSRYSQDMSHSQIFQMLE